MSTFLKLGMLGDRSGILFCAALGVATAAVLGLRLRSERSPQLPAILATVDTQKTYQSITGFGASTAYYQDWLVAHPQREAIYAALYSELRLDILRLRNTYEAGKPHFAAVEKEIFDGATHVLGHPPLVMISSWSPPAALKSLGQTRNGGTLTRRGGSYDYVGFAHWWRDSVVAYQQLGLSPDYVSIQNEPDWKAEWETCLFQPQETAQFASYSKALVAVSGALKTLPAPPKLIGPETLGVDNPQAFLPTNQTHLVDAVAHHLYKGGDESDPDSFNPQLHAIRDHYPRTPKFQTEFGRGDGFLTAWLIHNCLTEEDASAYLHWAAVWPDHEALITLNSPWSTSSWKTPQGFQRTDRFFALKHYSRFLKPGFIRVGIQAPAAELRLSAFLSPDGTQLVVVGLNTSELRTIPVGLGASGFVIQERYRTDFKRQENCKALAADDEKRSLVLPPHALATWVLSKDAP